MSGVCVIMCVRRGYPQILNSGFPRTEIFDFFKIGARNDLLTRLSRRLRRLPWTVSVFQKGTIRYRFPTFRRFLGHRIGLFGE